MKTKIALLATLPAIIALITINSLGAQTQDAPVQAQEQPAPSAGDAPRISRQEGVRYMLELVNRARGLDGVSPVTLGVNPAAQMHAEAALRNCTISHWDQWGLKPNHRYTLTGGTGTGNENALGRNYCPQPGEGIGPYDGITRGDIRDTVVMWLASPGHLENILNPRHTTMNAGIAWDAYSFAAVQQFSSDYVEYRERPGISPQGVLTLSGSLRNATLPAGQQVVVRVGYDPPPHPLTRGQLAKTFALCAPRPVGTIRAEPDGEPPLNSTSYPQACRDPYRNSPGTRAPRTLEESQAHWQEARGSSALVRNTSVRVRRITPQVVRVTPTEFDITADLSPVTEAFGPGVYSVTLWGVPARSGGYTILSEQSVFWQTQPPRGNPYAGTSGEK